MSLPSQTERTESWPPDIRIMAKYMTLLWLLIYAQWSMNIYSRFDGIFEIDGGYPVGGDFINYWSAAKLALSHSIMTLFDIDGFREAQQTLFGHKFLDLNNWSYPPVSILLILWLGFFPYLAAFGFWIVITFALYAFAVCYQRPKAWPLVLVLIFAPATYANFDSGQNGFLSAALLVGGLRLMETRPMFAGVLLGLLSFKPQLGLLIPFALLAARKWRVFMTAAITTLILIGLSIVLWGIEPWKAYFEVTIPYQQKVFLEADTLLTTAREITSPFMAMRILGFGPPIAYAVNVITALGAILAVIYAFRCCSLPDLRNAVLLTAIFLTSPHIFCYDMTILSAAVIATTAACGAHVKPYVLLVFLAAWTLPPFLPIIQKTGFPAGPLVIGALLALQILMIKTQNAGQKV